MKKLFLALFMLIAVATIASATTSYIKIQYDGAKYVVHPATEQDYQQALATQETNVGFYSSTMAVNEFAQAGTFGAYNTLDEAIGAIKLTDSQAIGSIPFVGGMLSGN
jgi:uncharacterized protein YxeA